MTQYECDVSASDDSTPTQSYRVTLVIAHEPPLEGKLLDGESSCLHLRYWVLMTHASNKFPINKKLDKKLTTERSALSTFATRESHRDVTALKMSIVVIVISQVTRICRSRASRWCRSKTCR